MNEVTPELAAALEAVRRAEQVVMSHYGRSLEVMRKADESPVTVADREAEAIIIQTIRSHFPDHSILGEESGLSQGDGDFVWVIDPIDGTKNFIRNIPLFGIELALIHNNEPVLGVSSIPPLRECLYAHRGGGAFLESSQQRLSVTNVARIRDAYINIGGLNHFVTQGKGQNLLRLLGAAGRVRSTGDAYAFHLLATGRCDAVIEASVNIWDIAALSVIVTEAGGRCTDLSGQPVTRAIKSALFSNGTLHQDLLDLLQVDSDIAGR